MRAMFMPCSASGIAQPTIASSIAVGSSPGTCRQRALDRGDQQVVRARVAEMPRGALPIGVRVAATM